MDNRFLQAVLHMNQQYHMLEAGDTVLCAVSGGADSVALLRALYALRDSLKLKICACHFNHQLRGSEAERDAMFVHTLCQQLEIPCQTGQGEVAQYAQQHGQGIEEAAREMRYAFFMQAAETLGANKIATAHTADDNLETILFRLARGSAGRGLCGIPPVRDCFIRPLLQITRAEIEAYLAALAQDFVHDSTNDSTEYTRNRIRHEIIPVLRTLNPQCAAAAGRAARLLQADEEYLTAQAQKLQQDLCKSVAGGIELDGKALLKAPPALRGRVLQQVLQQLHMPMRQCTQALLSQLQALIAQKNPSAAYSLPQGLTAQRQYDKLWIGKAAEQPAMPPIPVAIGFSDRLWNTPVYLTISKYSKNQGDFNKKFNTFYVDCDKINLDTLHVRTRQTGDILQPHQKSGHSTLKKLMIARHIPRTVRDTLAVLADCNGVIAVQNIGADYNRLSHSGNTIEIRFEGSTI